MIRPEGYIAGTLLMVGSCQCLEGLILLSLGGQRKAILRTIRSRMGQSSDG